MVAGRHCCVALAYALAVVVVGSGCGKHSQYSCESSSQCFDHSAQGTCEPSGFCAFPDPACPSGDRYEPNAGGGLGGVCVEPGTGIDSGIDGTAPACGAVGMACCPDSSCGDNAFCAAGTCQQCYVDIAIGRRFSCAVRYDGTVWCAGDNTSGQLGIGTLGGLPQATRMQAKDNTSVFIADAKSITAGEGHACVLRGSGGAVWCWGHNGEGQLGDNGTSNHSTARQAQLVGGALMTGMTALAAADDSSCAVDGAGTAWCWGSNDDYKLGDGTTVTRGQAAQVLAAVGGAPFPNVATLTLGTAGQSCLRTTGNEIWCWGYNGDGQVGNNATVDQPVPVKVLDGKSVAGGRLHTCAVELDGTVWCWGSSNKYRLGAGSRFSDRLVPTAVLASSGGAPFGGAASVVAGGMSCALMTTGQVYCWGTNSHGQLGTGVGTYVPMPVIYPDGTPISGVTRLVANYTQACAFLSDGRLLCWGRNDEGQFGDGTFVSHNFATAIKATCP